MITVTGKGTTRQTIRIDPETWAEFGQLAERMGSDRSTLVREFIEWSLRREGVKPPRRPGVDEVAE